MAPTADAGGLADLIGSGRRRIPRPMSGREIYRFHVQGSTGALSCEIDLFAIGFLDEGNAPGIALRAVAQPLLRLPDIATQRESRRGTDFVHAQ